MVQRVLERLEGEPVDVFIVWLPAIGGDRYDATENAMTLIPDARARHYWDGSQALGEAFSPVLGIRAKLAWDVYLVFDKGTAWGELPPDPADWMHQLIGEDPKRALDEEGLEAAITSALDED